MVRVSEQEKKRIRQSILEVSKRHFEQKGYDDTKTKDIAKEVGIAEGTLFNYFDTKTEIFLEAMASGYIIDADVKSQVDYKESVVSIIYDLIYKTMKPFEKIPRKIIKELAAAGVNMAKKKPELIKKIIQLDYDLIEDLKEVIQKLIDSKRLKAGDVDVYAQTIYSVLVVEMVLYVYEEKISKEKMLQNIKTKIAFVLEGHIL